MGGNGEKFMTRSRDDRQGVILSSGGADGAYAVGVLKALVTGESAATGYIPLYPEVLVGSSIGALNAALVVSQLENGAQAAVSYLEHIWLNEMAQTSQTCGNGAYRIRLNPMRLLDPRCLASAPTQHFATIAGDGLLLARDWLLRSRDFATSSEALEQRTLRLVNLGSFISGEPLLSLIQRTIRFEDIRRSKTALRIMATNWTKGGLEEFSNADLTDDLGPRIIKASAAIPGFFQPVEIDDDIYVDASVLGYTTLAPAINAGADTLHVIYVDPDVKNIPVEALQSTLDTLYRTFVIQWANDLEMSIRAVARINGHVDVLERTIREAKLSKSQAEILLKDLLPPGSFKIGPSEEILGTRKIAVHLYHPEDDLFGPLGLLNLDRRRLEDLISRGFDDAVGHECANSGCVLSQSAEQVQAAAA
jgi:predicted acylesterase/phospholipase RssA